MSKSFVSFLILLIGTILFCCLCLVLTTLSSILIGFTNISFEWGDLPYDLSTVIVTPVVIRPESLITPTPRDIENPTDSLHPENIFRFQGITTETLELLNNANVPVNDLVDLARRLEGKNDIPLTIPLSESSLHVGAVDTFWVNNADTDANFMVTANLGYITEHAYFWIEDGLAYNERDLGDLAEIFENQIYPTNRAFFGSEWTPGVDNDPHLYIIFVSGIGNNLAGYFSPADEYHPLAHEYSNAHETFILNADNVDLDEEFTYGVLAHEFQHMIQWHRDRNESTWLNEGFSELAAFINGFDVGGFDYLYTDNPDIQLNDWPNDKNETSAHYGAAFLFVTYFLDRFGETATHALVAHQSNGLGSVDAVLAELDVIDPLSGETITADDLFLDWVAATYLQDNSVSDGRYTYRNYSNPPRPFDTEHFSSCPIDLQTRDVHQYGVDYIRISCKGEYSFSFEGSISTRVVPEEPHSGSYYYWSNKGDESDMTLTQTFDFSEINSQLTLSYWTWFDLEEGYDYLYLEASLDGEVWKILAIPSGTLDDPSGNSYGEAYNGLSGSDGRWIYEEVDISEFAGENVQIRFEYVTDAAVNGEGFLLDDVSIPQIEYFTDFEDDSGGWDGEGFVRIQNIMPQSYRLALLSIGKQTTIEKVPLNEENSAVISFSIGDDVKEVVLLVSGTTRYTRQKAAYRFEVIR